MSRTSILVIQRKPRIQKTKRNKKDQLLLEWSGFLEALWIFIIHRTTQLPYLKKSYIVIRHN